MSVETVEEAVLEQETAIIPLDAISVLPGHNPRRYFDAEKLAELVQSIMDQGVLQPITLRPNPVGGYYLVAGERRFRAARDAGLSVIPALIRQMDERQAIAAAVAENAQRENISPAEEAQVARQAVDLSEGSEDEAAKLLGWSRSRLRSRLGLLTAVTAVLDAQMRGEIKLGHAELLATLPELVQVKVLAKVMADKVPVEELKAQLASYTQDLSAAPFDTRGCVGCPKNSSTQASLFEQHIGDGRCSDRVCWSDKTTDYLVGLKEAKSTEFNVVWFDKEKVPGTYVRLVVDGKEGVGATQAEACKGCGNFGAMICTVPGKEGRVADGVCFNTACNAEMVAANAAAHSEKNKSVPAKSVSVPPPVAAAGEVEANNSVRPAPKVADKATIAAVPKKAIEANVAVLRSVARETVLADEHLQLAAECLGLSRAGKFLCADAFELSGGRRTQLRHLIVKDIETLKRLKAALLAELFDPQTEDVYGEDNYGRERVRDAASIIALRGVTLEGRFVLTREYLSALTKSGLEALMVDAGFVNSCEGDTPAAREKALTKLFSGKREDIITAILASKHDFSKLVPTTLSAALRESLRGDRDTYEVIKSLVKASTSTAKE